MAETPSHGITDQATYLIVTYLLRRQEMQDLAAGKFPTACDELINALDAGAPHKPTHLSGDNVIALFAHATSDSNAFEELRELVLRVRRVWRPDDKARYEPGLGNAEE